MALWSYPICLHRQLRPRSTRGVWQCAHTAQFAQNWWHCTCVVDLVTHDKVETEFLTNSWVFWELRFLYQHAEWIENIYLIHASELEICPIECFPYVCIGSHAFAMFAHEIYEHALQWWPFTKYCVYSYLDAYFHCMTIHVPHTWQHFWTMWCYPDHFFLLRVFGPLEISS